MKDDVLKETRRKMDKVLEAMARDLSRVRTGRASVALLEGIKVDFVAGRIYHVGRGLQGVVGKERDAHLERRRVIRRRIAGSGCDLGLRRGTDARPDNRGEHRDGDGSRENV